MTTEIFTTEYSRSLPSELFGAAACREIDREAIAAGTAGYVLMQRASAAAFQLLQQRWPDARSIVVVCGAGNNAGDGYVLARLALEAGLQVDVRALVEPARLRGDALQAYQDYVQAEGAMRSWSESFDGADVIVDALFGTGLGRSVDGEFAAVIARINRAGLPVLALDVPSGLSADTGASFGAVKATATITFIANKVGLHTGDAPLFVGELWFTDLAISSDIREVIEPSAVCMSPPLIPARSPVSHKGSHGHVLVIGGDHSMGGAARLAVEGALRGGSGKVSLITRKEHIAPVQVASPEAMPASDAALTEKLTEATVIAIGPGLGTGEWGQELLQLVLEQAGSRPVVADADALNLLAKNPVALSPRWVLTPHPGEAANLLGISIAAVQSNRPAALAKLVEKYNAVVVLKGNGTLVGAPDFATQLCPFGNPGMASGGMGDVLVGIAAAFLAQDIGGSFADSAAMAVAAHALAADRAAEEMGQRGLLARDVVKSLMEVIN